MTSKQKLYLKYLEIANEYYTLNGEVYRVIDITEDFLDSNLFKVRASQCTLEHWENLISLMKSKLEQIKKYLHNKTFYETDEGKAYKTLMLLRQDELEKKLNDVKDSGVKKISDFIEIYLGYGWSVTYIGESQTDIAYNGYYSFTIHYNNGVFRMNYPTIGAFDLFIDEDRRNYLIGMGKFVSDKVLLTKLYENIRTYLKDYYEIQKELDEVINKIDNPLD